MHIDKVELKTVIAENTLTDTPECRDRSVLNGKSRRMKLLERRGCFGSLPPEICISRAITFEDLRDAYRSVHDSYVEKGYILPHPCGIRIRPFEAIPETATFVAKVDERIVGVTSVVTDSPDLGVPADKVFRNEIDKLRYVGDKVSEGTNWVIDPEYRSTSVMPELLRACFAHSVAAGCHGMLAIVSPNHRPFYEILLFENIGSERSSSSKIDDPVILQLNNHKIAFKQWKALEPGEKNDIAVVTNSFIRDNPYFEKVGLWSALAKSSFSDPTFLRRLFVDTSNFLNDCESHDLKIIRQRWGTNTFSDVWNHHVLCGNIAS